MKRALLTASFLFVAFQVWATTPQVLFGGNSSTKPAVASNQFFFIMGHGVAAFASEANIQCPMPSSGTFSNLRVQFASSVGTSTTSFAISLRVNGVTQALSCSVNGTTTGNKCNDPTDQITVGWRDKVDWISVPTATPLLVAMTFTATFTPSGTDGYFVCTQNTGTGSSTVFLSPIGASANGTSESTGNGIISPPGTFSNLTVLRVGAAGAGNTRTFTVRTSGANTLMTAAITGASQTTAFDLVDSSTTAAGELVNINVVPSGTPTSANEFVSMQFTPTNPGEFPIIANSGGNYGTSVTNYMALDAINVNFNATEANNNQIAASPSPGLVIKNLYAVATAAQGAGKTVTMTLRKNAASPGGGPSCTMSNATTCNDPTGSLTVSDDDLLDTATIPGGGVITAARAQIGYTGFFSQGGGAVQGVPRGLSINGGKLQIIGGKVSVL